MANIFRFNSRPYNDISDNLGDILVKLFLALSVSTDGDAPVRNCLDKNPPPRSPPYHSLLKVDVQR